MHFELAARAIQGGRRNQEDSWRAHTIEGHDLSSDLQTGASLVLERGVLLLVADGLGGARDGAQASKLVSDNFCQSFLAGQGPYESRLAEALSASNEALAVEKSQSRFERSAGTTLVACFFLDHKLTFVSVGDCSIWRFRDEEIHRVNATHETVAAIDIGALVEGSEAAWAAALLSPHRGKSQVTSAVTGSEILEKQIATREVRDNDIHIIASDGIETLSLEHLRRAMYDLGFHGNISAIADGLTELIRRIGGSTQDNATLLVVKACANSANG